MDLALPPRVTDRAYARLKEPASNIISTSPRAPSPTIS